MTINVREYRKNFNFGNLPDEAVLEFYKLFNERMNTKDHNQIISELKIKYNTRQQPVQGFAEIASRPSLAKSNWKDTIKAKKLSPKQEKLDKDNNGKIDGEDFKILNDITKEGVYIRKEHSPLLEGLSAKEKKKVKKILQTTEPSEYFGQDYTKLEKLIILLMEHNLVKADAKLSKKMTRLEEANIKMVATAAKLRKDYETLYSQIRNIVYPGKGGSLTEEGEEK